VLLALDAGGGKLTRTALARALSLPLLRVTGLIAALRRLLNVDGYPVLAVDESDTVELSRALLMTQFELER
jgi:tRNA G18 (ribose-2'-O)-methylase SpoU